MERGAEWEELSWGALGAGAPYWEWYYKGGMYGSEASQSPELNQPGPIELEAMAALNASNPKSSVPKPT